MEENGSMQQGVDSRAMFATFMTKLPKLFILTVAGAVLGSGLNLLITLVRVQEICYVSETEYYIAFARDKAKDHYNDFTWNDVLATDEILGRAMELLGDGYERNQVKEMIGADILSDVRYLTITVKGKDYGQVEQIKNALGTALEEFGAMKEEFSSIYKIEDVEIVQEEIPYFVWRAAFLGAVIALGAGVFVTALRFCMGSVFYTKSDITTRLGIPVSGMTFRDGHHGSKNSAMEQRQAQMLKKSLQMLAQSYSRILLMDASEGQEAAALLQEINDRGIVQGSVFHIYDPLDQKLQDAAMVVVIPFGRTYRERITDEIGHAQQHGGRIVSAVITQADRTWTKIYYAQGKWERKMQTGRM